MPSTPAAIGAVGTELAEAARRSGSTVVALCVPREETRIVAGGGAAVAASARAASARAASARATGPASAIPRDAALPGAPPLPPTVRAPQSVQSVPSVQSVVVALGPPSSQMPSEACWQLLLHPGPIGTCPPLPVRPPFAVPPPPPSAPAAPLEPPPEPTAPPFPTPPLAVPPASMPPSARGPPEPPESGLHDASIVSSVSAPLRPFMHPPGTAYDGLRRGISVWGALAPRSSRLRATAPPAASRARFASGSLTRLLPPPLRGLAPLAVTAVTSSTGRRSPCRCPSRSPCRRCTTCRSSACTCRRRRTRP